MGVQTGKLSVCHFHILLYRVVHKKVRCILITCAVNILFSELDARYCRVLAKGLYFII